MKDKSVSSCHCTDKVFYYDCPRHGSKPAEICEHGGYRLKSGEFYCKKCDGGKVHNERIEFKEKIAALEQKLAQESIGYDRALERIAELDDKLAQAEADLKWYAEVHEPEAIKEYKHVANVLDDLQESRLREIVALEQKLAAKQEALEKFGRHEPSCQHYVNRELCDCGFNKEKSNG